MTTDVTVIGAGVVGLSCAHELAVAGYRVTVVADHRPADTVSAVAAAIWEPYDVQPAETALEWSMTALERFADIAGDPSSGVVLRAGTVVNRGAPPDIWWTANIPTRPAEADETPAGAVGGTVCTVPVIVMPRYLRWLETRCVEAGVQFSWRRVESLDDVDGDGPIVVACGLRSGELTGDETLVPGRGQIVRLANPGLTHWYFDDDNPRGMTYVIPRLDDVVCGGTNDHGSVSMTPDPAVTESLIARAVSVEPRLAGAQVLESLVGLRPTRPTVRVERLDYARPTIASYGHGGAGVTTSWGTAAAVVDLVTQSTSIATSA